MDPNAPVKQARQLDENEYNQYLYGLGDDDDDIHYQQHQYQNVNGLPLNGLINIRNHDNDLNVLQAGLIAFGAIEFVNIAIFIIICLVCLISVILAAFGGYHHGQNRSSDNHGRYVKDEGDDDQNDENIV